MIGTIADLMPLEDENQAMVNIGLKQIKKTTNLGLRKILTYSDLEIINQTAIAFQIAPKINSSGRLNQAEKATELLVTDDIRKVNDLILEIEENHVIRKRYTQKSFHIAEDLVNYKDQILVLASETFHEGVIGICAQRIAEKYQKPTIVLKIENGIAKGSARTFGKISMLGLLKEADDLLDRYGGHTQAAGMQLQADQIVAFKDRLNAIDIKDTEPVLDIDMEVDINQISKETIQRLQNKSFHTALFLVKSLRVIRKQIIGKNHTKLLLASNHRQYEAIKFNDLEYYYNLNVDDMIDVCGGITINKFRNRETIQIMITDLQCTHLQVLDYRRSLNTVDIQNNLFDEFIILNDETVLNSADLNTLMVGHQSFALFPKFLHSNYNQIIDRNEMVKIYVKLKKLPYFSKFDIISTLGTHEWVANTVLKIFSELHLIKKAKDGFIFKSQTKTDLTQSKTYQDIFEKKKTIDWLYHSTNQEIKHYLEGKNGL
ncbi:MAG TPA: DHHA1 domain-containing protein, partial [Candidatus Izemoplasmatales bacterium]|nr:DHHA1 domain-containing protein [Candidatus Izemoplasmatales bacterium]